MSCAARTMSPIPALQLQMFEALGAAPPAFAHEALLVGSEGKLSKRLGSLGVEAMREAGIEPRALLAKLARIGTSLPVEPVAVARAADRRLRFRDASAARRRASTWTSWRRSTPRIVHQLAFAAVADRLPGRHERSGLDGDPAQSRARRRGGGLVGDPARPCRAARRRRRIATSSPRAAEAAGGDRLERRRPGRSSSRRLKDRAQRQGALPSAAPGAHRPRQRPRNGGAAAADRPRRGGRAAARGSRH